MKPSPSTVNVRTLDYNALKLDIINYKAGNIKIVMKHGPASPEINTF